MNGSNGAKGDTGAAGTKGNTGAAGTKGNTGAAGTNGSNGAKGDTGAAGPEGGASQILLLQNGMGLGDLLSIEYNNIENILKFVGKNGEINVMVSAAEGGKK